MAILWPLWHYQQCYQPQSPSNPILNLFPNWKLWQNSVICRWEVLEKAWRSPFDSQLQKGALGTPFGVGQSSGLAEVL